ncbi:adenylate/guanylate cyclase domain-containing protein [Desertibaculum subflavum]|uniref:adenylate/guanylate cyclase domain-containing protein n=1 Tax=Desertibaculum subflavum TaxID=2268458 RepID=UPI000E661FD0
MASGCAAEIQHWLMTGTGDIRFAEDVFAEMCNRFLAAGVPIARASLHLLANNPQWMGARFIWRRTAGSIETHPVGYEVKQSDAYIKSPFGAIRTGAEMVRHRVDRGAGADLTPALLAEFRAEGLVDYVAWPLKHMLGKRHMVTFASDAPDGFTDAQVAALAAALPALALVTEVRLKTRLARTLLETYVGPHAGQKILDGAIRRGDGETIRAAIIVGDLRNFTTLSSTRERDHVIAVLNEYFDALCQPIERNGGEILKFMGDGLLAIFPLDEPDACRRVLRTIVEILHAVAEVNARHRAAGQQPLGYGIGVHLGDVMYGNIGSRNRLDFTVIGPAVNIASRLESLTKEVGRPVLLSQAFAEMAGDEAASLERLGDYALKGLAAPVTVFALAEAGGSEAGATPDSRDGGHRIWELLTNGGTRM